MDGVLGRFLRAYGFMVRWAVGAICAGVVVAPASAKAPAMRGWTPMVLFAGAGDRARAVDHLRALSKVSALAQKHLEIDRPTQEFTAGVFDALEDFAVDDLYEMLPERQGPWRRLRVFGEVSGNRYRIGRPRAGVDIKVGKGGHRRALGDFSGVAKIKPVADREDSDDHNFLIRGQVGMGIGPIGPTQITAAVEDTLRILDADPGASQPAQNTLDLIARYHPKLARHERRLMAVPYESFPELSQLVERFGQVESLVVHAPDAGRQYQHVKAAFRIEPERLELHYEQLADYLDSLGSLADVRLEVVDGASRRLLSIRFKTEALRGEVEFFVRHGQIVPSQRRGPETAVFWKSPVSLEKALVLRAYATAHFEVMGIDMHMRRMPIELRYKPGATGFVVRGRARKMPTVEVGGAVLGVIPAGLVDAFIPSNMEGLAIAFLRTAVEGNHGRGVAFEFRHDRPSPAANATIEVDAGLEALDNFLVTLGVGIAADRIVPDDDEARDMERALWHAHLAFKSDLARYTRLVR